MAKDRKRARSIAQAQKKRQQEKAFSAQSAPPEAASDGGGARSSVRPFAGPRPSRANMDRKITFRLDEERSAELEALAEREGASLSFVVRRLVISFLDQKRNAGAW